jgi:hypothetical protein
MHSVDKFCILFSKMDLRVLKFTSTVHSLRSHIAKRDGIMTVRKPPLELLRAFTLDSLSINLHPELDANSLVLQLLFGKGWWGRSCWGEGQRGGGAEGGGARGAAGRQAV